MYWLRLAGRVSFRDRDRNPNVLNSADGRLEQDAENPKGCAVPYRVLHGVIVTVVIHGREPHIWWTIGYIDLQRRCGPCICPFSGHVRVNVELRGDPNTCGDKIKNLKH